MPGETVGRCVILIEMVSTPPVAQNAGGNFSTVDWGVLLDRRLDRILVQTIENISRGVGAPDRLLDRLFGSDIGFASHKNRLLERRMGATDLPAANGTSNKQQSTRRLRISTIVISPHCL